MSSSELVNYQVQLQQVEAALASDPNNEEMIKLKSDLEEVIQLTKSLMGYSDEPVSTSAGGSGSFSSAVAASNTNEYKSGDPCMAPWSEDGQFYEATVEDLTSDGQCTVVFHSLPNGRYKTSEVCLVALLKPSEKHRRKQNKQGKVDPLQQREMLRKKQQKKQSRLKDLEEAREKDKMKWKQFNQKAVNKHLKGAATIAKKQSIFKSPETVEGKVGVGTCGIGGRPMTTFDHFKYKKGSLSSSNLPSNIVAAMSKSGSSSAYSSAGTSSSSSSRRN